MNELKEKALSKMLEEMNKDHSPAEDAIHNWLCEQDDDELFQGVLKDGYTIKMALKYAKDKAREFAQNGVACIDDEIVFGWVREYFLANSKLENIKQVPVEPVKKTDKKVDREIDVAKIKKGVGPNDDYTKPAKKTKKEKGVADGQIDLFADLFDEI
ncbi:Cas9 inhibitor AcrIIA9 family protein [Streptococcus hillyeri]|uniref:Phage protein n=1 Tax=Streptococcus hillyeri TaxID=2282420 RepID=A0A3L9DP62_9STRE|nr:Cas9 inhibitor AcrIIA9 family protein [Streptococcus hillyeri]RLY03101.1 hypothetical protein EAF07_06050 [Streptococcus hillyeri]